MNWSTPLLFSFPGLSELVVIFIVMLLVFGERLPSVARKMGRYIGGFRRQIDGLKDELLYPPHEKRGGSDAPPNRPPETQTPLIVERKTIKPQPADAETNKNSAQSVKPTEKPVRADETDGQQSQTPDNQEP
ncbi:MAG: twin-arginine translocase TatA/TatE family subunit [Planctomycetota bacterium]